MRPSDFHPDLTDDRLNFVAQLIADGRNTALDRYDALIGCDGWTVGCEAFAFSKFEIESAADDVEWLAISDSSKRFIFRIGSVLVRFYKGEPSDPTERTLRTVHPELDQMQLSLFAFDGDHSLENRVCRFAVSTYDDGSISQISFVILEEWGQPVQVWPIQFDDRIPALDIVEAEEEPVILASPPVGDVDRSGGKRQASNDDLTEE